MRRFERVDGLSDAELDMDEELFDEPNDALAMLAGLEASLDDLEPWQRLGDVLGQITGEASTD